MFLNFILAATIIADIFGFSPANVPNENQKVEKTQVLGEKSVPKININSIYSYPVKKQNVGIDTLAKSAAVVDLKTNKYLYKKNTTQVLPIASITKLMTAVVIIEDFDINENVTITPDMAYEPGTLMHLRPGEVIKAKKLIDGMLIASANDAARSLETHFGKDKVVSKMNEKAKFLKMENTSYTDATGLDVGDKSTVEDLITLSEYAIKIPQIRYAIKAKEAMISSEDGLVPHLIHTTNRLLKNYPDIFGVKTGFTNEAGNCLIAGAKQNDHPILSVVLGMDNYDLRFSQSRDLLNWAFATYNW